jgi:hypothetical protein|tara:strand:+ start:1264 stop:1566 length:303 start_codon:yes stop_codon:yes gene_type:complete
MKKYSNGVLVDMTEQDIAQYKKDLETENSSEIKLQKIKNIRLDKLIETDWWVLRGNMTDAQTQYRQKLRDIPADYDSSKYDALLARDSEGQLTHTVWTKP